MPAEELPESIISPVRLSRRDAKLTTARMKRFLKLCRVTETEYKIWNGQWSYQKEINENPTWSLRAWEVLAVENLEIIHNTEWK